MKKAVTNEGKVFGKINIIDLLVLIVIIAAVVVAGYFLTSGGKSEELTTTIDSEKKMDWSFHRCQRMYGSCILYRRSQRLCY